MKIAMIVPYPIFPPDEGGRVRAYNLLKQLSRRHDVLLFTPRSAGNQGCDLKIDLHEATPAGRRHQVLDFGFLRHALAIARARQPDVIVSEYPWPGLHAAWLARRLGVPLVLDAPNVEGDRFRSTGSRVWPAVAAYERIIARIAASVFVVSEADRDRFRRAGVPSGKLQVVPNGVDPETVRPDPASGEALRATLGISETTAMLLFFGQLSYAPNKQALALIRDELIPRLDRAGADYAFVIAGKDAGPRSIEEHPKLRVVGAVPSIVPWINAADLTAVPVVSGGGTRLKILESVGCATPVVSTSVGAEGINAADCGGLLTIVDGWDEFSDALGRTRNVKSGNVPARFLDMYSWANIVSRIEWPT